MPVECCVCVCVTFFSLSYLFHLFDHFIHSFRDALNKVFPYWNWQFENEFGVKKMFPNELFIACGTVCYYHLLTWHGFVSLAEYPYKLLNRPHVKIKMVIIIRSIKWARKFCNCRIKYNVSVTEFIQIDFVWICTMIVNYHTAHNNAIYHTVLCSIQSSTHDWNEIDVHIQFFCVWFI